MMPKALLALYLSQPGVFDTDIYADYFVEPLAPDEPGHMRPVKIITARKLVVTYGGNFVLKKASIDEEPDQRPDIARP